MKQCLQTLANFLNKNTNKMGNQSSSETTLNDEDFANALFEKVRTFHEEDAAKITGMLLEMPQNDLRITFADDSKLMSQIYEAIKTLEYEKDRTRREILGDVIYSEVEALYSQHEIAEKLTGMLLEMKLEDIEELLDNKSKLLAKIHEAAEALQRHNNNTEKMISQINDDVPSSKVEMGEKLFDSISKWYQDEDITAKLTGMLLEMNTDEIQKLVQNEELLKCKTAEAYNALSIQR